MPGAFDSIGWEGLYGHQRNVKSSYIKNAAHVCDGSCLGKGVAYSDDSKA